MSYKDSGRNLIGFEKCFGLIVACSLCFDATLCFSETWRSDITNAQVTALAQQKQFAGSGKVVSGFTGGTGVAIAPGWVLTAAHVVRGKASATFTLDGIQYAGVPRTTDGTSFADSDVALIQLNANAQLPASTPFVAPSENLNPVGELVWIAGRGDFGPRGGGPLSSADNTVRAGTNVVTGRDTVPIGGIQSDAIIYQQNDTAPNSTAFEVSTAPGDSGGPTYLQHNNQWFIVGTTIGVIVDQPNGQLRVRPAQADVSSVYDWIEATTGLTFSAQAAPTDLTFDSNFTLSGVQSDPLGGFAKIWDTTRPMFTGGADGFNYTWENDFATTAVFGTATTEPSIVRIQSDITFGEIRFDLTDPTGNPGPFQLTDDGGSLRAAAGGSTIEVNRFSAISAALKGNEIRDITKTGDADLLLNGNSNSGFDAEFTVAAGTLIVRTDTALGTGGFDGNVKTTVADGATLQLGSAGVTLNEHMHINGSGYNGNGAIEVNTGNHTLTERIAVRTDSVVDVAANSSLTIGGALGRFYSPAGETPMLTKSGDGTVVFDNISNIMGLTVSEGVAAGNGGINRMVTIGDGAELRPGDNALTDGIGNFETGDLALEIGSILSIDLDPMANLFDQLNVDGTLSLGGMLDLNLESAPTLGQSFLIIDNDLMDLVTGTFSNASFVSAMFGGEDYLFAIDYAAGSGNDVSLTSISNVLLGDVDFSGAVDFLDISPFIAVLSGGPFQAEADCDESGTVDFLDIAPFIAILSGS